MGLLLPPPHFNLSFSASSFVSPGSAKALKRLLTTRFAKMMLTPRSALKVHEPYISHEIADSHFTRASFVTEALVSQNGNRYAVEKRINELKTHPYFLISFF